MLKKHENLDLYFALKSLVEYIHSAVIEYMPNSIQNLIMYFNKFNIAFLLTVLSLQYSLAADSSTLPVKKFPVTYVSQVDQDLILKAVVVPPAYDNVGGVYKKAAEKKLFELISEDDFWTYTSMVLPKEINPENVRADWYEERSDFVKRIITTSKADSLLTVITTKSSTGITVNLTLYTRDGSPLIAINHRDETLFEINRFNDLIKDLYGQLKAKLPYVGLVASRKGNQVTVNVGAKNGVQINDQISIAQIIHIKRHPKLKIMTGVEKEVIGQVVIDKVESDLSFGHIIFEKESGVIDKGSKLLPISHVQYADPRKQNSSLGQNLENQEWVPAEPPQYGKVHLGLGLNSFSLSGVDKNTGASYESSQFLSPTVKLGLELWLTQEWFGQFNLQQTFLKADNGLKGSSPSDLTINHAVYDLLFGYKYSLTGNFWGPQLTFGLGYLSGITRVGDSSPVSFTSTELNAWQLHIGGHFPISEDYKMAVGAQIKFLFFNKFSESPVGSGNADPRYTNFGLYYAHSLSPHFVLKPSLDYSLMSVRYSGNGNRPNPARSLDEKSLIYACALEYLF